MIRSPKSLGNCLYQDETGTYWLRFSDSGKQKWHKLKSIKERAARQEATGLQVQLAQFKAGVGANPFEDQKAWKVVAESYLAQQCPDSQWQPRHEAYCAGERKRIETLMPFYGKKSLPEITLKLGKEYAKWRMDRVKKGTGHRSVELEAVTLSNVMSYAVREELINVNLVRCQRPNYTTNRENHGPSQRLIKHCREESPKDGNEVHEIANLLFAERLSEALGWQFLFECMTGCRTNEVLHWRIDGQNKTTPGYIQGQCLFLRRSKRGHNPYFQIYPELEEAIRCHHYWHQLRWSKSSWWFPGRNGVAVLGPQSLWHALDRLRLDRGLPKRTSHGCRAFYATKGRSDGKTDDQIAAEMGIADVKLIQTTYGLRDPAFAGSGKLSWLPSEGLSSWSKWRPQEEKVVGL